MLAFVIAASLADGTPPPPQIAVAVTGRNGLSELRAEAIAVKITDLLAASGLPVAMGPKETAQKLAAAGVKNASECQGKRLCVSGLGRVLRIWGIVGLELADLDGTLALHVELVDSDAGEPHAQHDAVLSSKKLDSDLPTQLLPFIIPLKEAIDRAKAKARPAPPSEPAKVAAPVVAQPPPEPAVLEPVLEPIEKRAPRSRGPAIATLGIGLAAAAVAVVFVVLAGFARADLDRALTMTTGGEPAYLLTQYEAQELVSRVNVDYSIALGTGIGAGVLVVLGAILFGVGP